MKGNNGPPYRLQGLDMTLPKEVSELIPNVHSGIAFISQQQKIQIWILFLNLNSNSNQPHSSKFGSRVNSIRLYILRHYSIDVKTYLPFPNCIFAHQIFKDSSTISCFFAIVVVWLTWKRVMIAFKELFFLLSFSLQLSFFSFFIFWARLNLFYKAHINS